MFGEEVAGGFQVGGSLGAFRGIKLVVGITGRDDAVLFAAGVDGARHIVEAVATVGECGFVLALGECDAHHRATVGVGSRLVGDIVT